MSCIVFEASKTTSFNAEEIRSISPSPNVRKKNYQSQHFQIKSGSLIDPTDIKRGRSSSTNISDGDHTTKKHSINKLAPINFLEIPRPRTSSCSDSNETSSNKKTKQKGHKDKQSRHNIRHKERSFPVLRNSSATREDSKQHQQTSLSGLTKENSMKQSRGKERKKNNEISAKTEEKEDEILRLQQKMARLQNKVASMQRKVMLLQKKM